MNDIELLPANVLHTASMQAEGASGFAGTGNIGPTSVGEVVNYQYEIAPGVGVQQPGLDWLVQASDLNNDFNAKLSGAIKQLSNIDPLAPDAFVRILDVDIQFTIAHMQTELALGIGKNLNQSFQTLYRVQG